MIDVSAASTHDTISATWTKPQADIVGYRLSLQPNRNTSESALLVEKTLDDAEKTSADFEGLLPETEYKIMVYSLFVDKESEGVELIAQTSELVRFAKYCTSVDGTSCT